MEPTKQEHGKQQYQVDPTNGLLNYDYNYGLFPILVFGFVSPIWFTEVESSFWS